MPTSHALITAIDPTYLTVRYVGACSIRNADWRASERDLTLHLRRYLRERPNAVETPALLHVLYDLVPYLYRLTATPTAHGEALHLTLLDGPALTHHGLWLRKEAPEPRPRGSRSPSHPQSDSGSERSSATKPPPLRAVGDHG